MPSLISPSLRTPANATHTPTATANVGTIAAAPQPLDFMAQSTPQLRAAVAKLAETMPAAEFAGVIASNRIARARDLLWLSASS